MMEDKILNILSGLRPEYDFTTGADFIEEGMLDSFDVVSLVSELEDVFSVTIDGEDIVPENFSGVDAIKALVERSGKT